MIACFRTTNMSLAEIRRYVDLLQDGVKTRPKRLEIMKHHQQPIQDLASLLQNNLTIVKHKIADMQAGKYI